MLPSTVVNQLTFQERRMRGDLIETFKIMEFLIMVDILSMFFLKLEIYCHDRFQKLCLLTQCIFLLIKLDIFDRNCLITSKTVKV